MLFTLDASTTKCTGMDLRKGMREWQERTAVNHEHVIMYGGKLRT